MKIEFVTGKGGVGKSVQAASLARAHQQKGRRVLLAELGDHSFYKDFFHIRSVTDQPQATPFGFAVSLWSGQSCLREYALHLLKVEKLYKLFFENPVSHALIQAAPALAELSMLGKITSGPPRNVGPRMPFDVIVVDAFSSGHFMALLKAPQAMAEIIKVGPMGAQSRSIFEVLKVSTICSYHIVTLPEELPLREALELKTQIHDLTGVTAKTYVNKWMQTLEDHPEWEKESLPWTEDFRSKRERQVYARKLLGDDFQTLPYVFDVETQALIEQSSAKWLELIA